MELRYATTPHMCYFYAAGVSDVPDKSGAMSSRDAIKKLLRAQGAHVKVDRDGFIAGRIYPGPGIEHRFMEEGWIREPYGRFIRSYVVASGEEMACK